MTYIIQFENGLRDVRPALVLLRDSRASVTHQLARKSNFVQVYSEDKRDANR